MKEVQIQPSDAALASGAEHGLVGRSETMRRLRTTIRRLAPIPAPVLVQGETGTGKELVAQALHDASPRSRGPLVTMNAGAIPQGLIASELFGHERGAFTGARVKRRGLFAEANGGTLVLDEIGELPLELQPWLLRVLETGEVRPLGAETPTVVDVRVIAASHVDLEHAVRNRRFRADLYFRLSVLQVRVPPLRERVEDLHDLALHLLGTFELPDRYELSPEALQALTLHAWPGNVRELRAVLLRAVAFARNTVLDANDVVIALGDSFRSAPSSTMDPNATALALAESGGNITEAARRLGVPRTTLRDALRSRERRARLAH